MVVSRPCAGLVERCGAAWLATLATTGAKPPQKVTDVTIAMRNTTRLIDAFDHEWQKYIRLVLHEQDSSNARPLG